MKIRVNEVFGPTIQGEGKYSGVPSIFIRLNGCNLRCSFKNPYGSATICDTPYTSHNPENKESEDVDNFIESISYNLSEWTGVNHIVITGGEPMLQQDAIIELIKGINKMTDRKITYTIETNGTINPKQEMYDLIDLWSVSPKLSNSCYFIGNEKVSATMQKTHNEIRLNFEALHNIYEFGKDCQFKFVWTGKECEDEINYIIMNAFYNYNARGSDSFNLFKRVVKKANIMLMPQGISVDEMDQSSKSAIQACIDNGWRFSDRLHIRIFGNKRGV